MSQFLAPQIVLLKDGTDTSQGLGQLGKFPVNRLPGTPTQHS